MQSSSIKNVRQTRIRRGRSYCPHFLLCLPTQDILPPLLVALLPLDGGGTCHLLFQMQIIPAAERLIKEFPFIFPLLINAKVLLLGLFVLGLIHHQAAASTLAIPRLLGWSPGWNYYYRDRQNTLGILFPATRGDV